MAWTHAAALLACVLLASHAAALRVPGGADGSAAASSADSLDYVCESFSADQCKQLAAHRCSLCKRIDGLELCFDPSIATQLTRYVFTCTKPTGGVAPPDPGDPQGCHAVPAGAECQAHASVCAVCDGPLRKQGCFSPVEARALPAVVFTCAFPPSAAGGA